MRNLHEHYDQLTEIERQFADETMADICANGRAYSFALANDDRAEEAVDALAKWIIESRRVQLVRHDTYIQAAISTKKVIDGILDDIESIDTEEPERWDGLS